MFKIWSISSLFLTGVMYYLFESGILHNVWNADATKLTFVITLIGLYSFCKLGRLTYLAGGGYPVSDKALDEGFELADTVMTLGMIGTVSGFIIMLSSFVGVDFSNTDNIKQLFGLATKGMSTALYTTFAGLVVYKILRLGYFSLENKLK